MILMYRNGFNRRTHLELSARKECYAVYGHPNTHQEPPLRNVKAIVIYLDVPLVYTASQFFDLCKYLYYLALL